MLVGLHDKSAIFYFAENAHAYESGPHGQWPFCSWKRRSLQVQLFAIGSKNAFNKGMLACIAAVTVRRKTCERCDHVFRSKRKVECNLREKAMKRVRAVESDSVKSARKAKDKCTRPVKEYQKFVSELCIPW